MVGEFIKSLHGCSASQTAKITKPEKHEPDGTTFRRERQSEELLSDNLSHMFRKEKHFVKSPHAPTQGLSFMIF